ncbi:MAG: MarR family transcriptional regulator [Candidatus Freyarchaeota archaeon]|nr:MarR family transcriptional regulator [Candidatus Jordarchaeia archaeon]MBS7269225.1 MarR family transcriptional regulator [Candidatus Jordarchaeia archaeon]MBS7279250.1 MarR family transcriptional regulator [Candidatus Jordarchaeia archaeon]
MEDEDVFEEGEVVGGDYKTLLKKLIDPRAKTMYSILELLLRNVKSEPVSASDIKDKLGISKQAATNAARRLEETGFITRTPEGYMVNQGFIINLLIQLVGEILKKLEL